MTQTLTLTQPDDWHCHLRDGDALQLTVAHTAKQFKRAIVMPNLVPAITTVSQAQSYRERILAHCPAEFNFDPLMTLYLTDNTSVSDIEQIPTADHVYAVKLYPQNATTHSHAGVTNIEALDAVFEAMAKHDIPLLIHGETTSENIDIFDREKVFIDQTLTKIIARYPSLKIVLEHITTADAVEYVQSQGPQLAATITAHHLLFDRNKLLVGGIKPHYYCLPILKSQQHQKALIKAAISGNHKFFLGTDSAPHARSAKESACGCAGIYTAHAALPLYAAVFEAEDALDRLEGFASHFGPDFYGLPRNHKRIQLEKKPWIVPETFSFGEETLIPLAAGDRLQWTLS